MPIYKGFELTTCGRDWRHDRHRIKLEGMIIPCTGEVPPERIPWGGLRSAVVLISQNEEEEKRLVDDNPGKFDILIRNEPRSSNKIKNLRVSTVCLSTEVVLAGVQRDLLETLEDTLVFSGVNVDEAFEVLR